MQWRRLAYPLAVGLFVPGFLVASMSVRELDSTPARAASLRLHGSLAAPGPRGQVRVVGRARGEAHRAVDGRMCLAEAWTVSRVTGSGKSRSVQTVCRGGERHALAIEAEGGARVEIAASALLRTDIRDDQEGHGSLSSLPLCPGLTDAGDSLTTYCLRPGEEVEAWGCLAPGSPSSLTACHDDPLGDAIEAPPRGGPGARLRDDTRQQLAVALLGAGACTLAALALLSTRLVRVRRPAGGGDAS